MEKVSDAYEVVGVERQVVAGWNYRVVYRIREMYYQATVYKNIEGKLSFQNMELIPEPEEL